MSEPTIEHVEKPPSTEPIEFSLTADQWAYIMSKLPKGYSLQQSKKTQRREKKDPSIRLADVEGSALKDSTLNDLEDAYENKVKRNRPKKVDRFLEAEPPRPKSKHTLPSERLTDEEMNRCYSYIQQLKKSPNAEPFLEPVNPIKLGIPDYFDVVKEPMDLSTVEKNLRTNQYSTVNQFHADINKIWMNSYRYNQKGSDIYRLTTEMEKLYKRITMKSAQQGLYWAHPTYTAPAPKKAPKDKQKAPAPPKPQKPKANLLHQMTISEKRQLCQDIKKLPKESLSGVWRIVATNRDGPNIELDVEKLELDKLWKLHAYVREVNTKGAIAKKQEEKKQPTEERPEYNQQEAYSAESSFLLDSDDN